MKLSHIVTTLAVVPFAVVSSSGVRGAGASAAEEASIRKLIATCDPDNRVPGSEKRKTGVMRIVVADSRELACEYGKSTSKFDLTNGKDISLGGGILRVWQKQGGEGR